MSAAIRDSSTSHAIAAGVVTAIVGFSSSFAVVLTGLARRRRQPGPGRLGPGDRVADAWGSAASCSRWLTGSPVTIAWSTPGPRCSPARHSLRRAGRVPSAPSSWPGCLYLLTAVVKPLGDWVARIPQRRRQRHVGRRPAHAVRRARSGPSRPTRPRSRRCWSPGWCCCGSLVAGPCPGALLAAVVVIVLVGEPLADGSLLPALTWTTPRLRLAHDGRHRRPALPRDHDRPEHPGRGRARVLRLPRSPALGAHLGRREHRDHRPRRWLQHQPGRHLRRPGRRPRGRPGPGPPLDRRRDLRRRLRPAGSALGVRHGVSASAPGRHHRLRRRGRADRHLRGVGVGRAVRRTAPRGRCRHVPGRGLRALLRRHQSGVLGARRGWRRAARPPAPRTPDCLDGRP